MQAWKRILLKKIEIEQFMLLQVPCEIKSCNLTKFINMLFTKSWPHSKETEHSIHDVLSWMLKLTPEHFIGISHQLINFIKFHLMRPSFFHIARYFLLFNVKWLVLLEISLSVRLGNRSSKHKIWKIFASITPKSFIDSEKLEFYQWI